MDPVRRIAPPAPVSASPPAEPPPAAVAPEPPAQAPVPSAAPPKAPLQVTPPPPRSEGGVVRNLSGKVMYRDGDKVWRPATEGMRIEPTWQLKSSDKNARADVVLAGGKRVAFKGPFLYIGQGTVKPTSRVAPPRVEMERNEVQRGLEALRSAPPPSPPPPPTRIPIADLPNS